MIESKVNKDLEKQIELYATGKLNAEQIDELWAELIQDEYYLDYMKSVVNVKAVIDEQNTTKPKAKIYRLKKMTQYAATAAVILIVGIVGVINFSSNNGSEMVNPIDKIGLEVVRDASGVSEAVTNETIRTAIKLASEGDVQQATSLLEEELQNATDPQIVADIALTLGSIQYNSGRYSSAIKNFRIVTNQENIDVLTLEKGYWFLGNAHFQLDELAEAELNFQKAYNLNGAYSRVAKTYVDALNNVL